MKAKMSKKSSITITVMACLLAVAVATTIVLAAFSANKTATTTVKFASGVQLKIDGAFKTASNAGDVDPISRTSSVDLLWGCTETGKTKNTTLDEIENVSSTVTFDAISFTNGTASESTTAWLIAKPSITCTVPAEPSAAQTAAATSAMTTALANIGTNGWVAIGSTGWYAYGTTSGSDVTLSSTALDMTDLAVGATAQFLSSTTLTSDPIDNLANATYVASIQVYAVNAGAGDAETMLQGIITPPTPTP